MLFAGVYVGTFQPGKIYELGQLLKGLMLECLVALGQKSPSQSVPPPGTSVLAATEKVIGD